MIGVLPIFDALQRAHMHRVTLDSVLHGCSQSGKIKVPCGVIGSTIRNGRKLAGVIVYLQKKCN